MKDKDEKVFILKSKKLFKPAKSFKLAMPDETLMENYGLVVKLMMGVARKIPILEEWKHVHIVYDLPDMKKPFNERIKALKTIVKENKERWDSIVSTLPEEFRIECPFEDGETNID